MTEPNPEYPSQNWTCSKCNEENGEYNAYCEYCKYDYDIIIYNPNKYFIREIRIEHITIRGLPRMTPQEELFAELFNHEKILVKDMQTLELRAHREELAKIAFEARARLTAVDDEDNNRKKVNSDSKPRGFERSLNTDETTTNAINRIKDRQTRMSKAEKIQAGLEKLGISTADAEAIMSAGVIKARLSNKTSDEAKAIEPKPFDPEGAKKFNPFEKK